MIDKTPLVSVVIPNYNGVKTIQSTIESVLDQTYLNIEIIVIDNCSVDNSIDLIEKIAAVDSRVRYLSTGCNSGGPAVPRNIGIKESCGDYIAFLDSDDIWHRQKIAIQLEVIKKYNATFVFCNKVTFDNESELPNENNEIFVVDNRDISKVSLDKLLIKNIISTSGTLIDKKILHTNMFNKSKVYVAIEDYELWLRIHNIINYSYFINIPLLYYRKSNNSLTPSRVRIFIKKIFLYYNFSSYNNTRPAVLRILMYVNRLFLDAVVKKINKK